MNRRLNYKFEDHKFLHRGVRYKSLMPEKVEQLPQAMDLRSACSPVEDQGNMGSCSGHAAAGAVEHLQIKNNLYTERVSRRFIYWGELAIENNTGTDGGATTLRDACNVLQGEGVCVERLCPYVAPDTYTVAPSIEAYTEAEKHRIPYYYGLESQYELKHCLSTGYPFMLGFKVYASFMGPQVMETGIMPVPGFWEACEGGHAVLCVGYDEAKQMFLVRNSWGPEWGLEGYFWMPYRVMDQYANDFYTLRMDPALKP